MAYAIILVVWTPERSETFLLFPTTPGIYFNNSGRICQGDKKVYFRGVRN
jgi:hypothetical protein